MANFKPIRTEGVNLGSDCQSHQTKYLPWESHWKVTEDSNSCEGGKILAVHQNISGGIYGGRLLAVNQNISGGRLLDVNQNIFFCRKISMGIVTIWRYSGKQISVLLISWVHENMFGYDSLCFW